MSTMASTHNPGTTQLRTSIIRIDQTGEVAGISGEFQKLPSANNKNAIIQSLLEEYLRKFAAVSQNNNRISTENVSSIVSLWMSSDAVLLDAELPSGEVMLLSRTTDSSGETVFISTPLAEKSKKQSLVEFLIDNSPQAFVANDKDTGKIIYLNSATRELYQIHDMPIEDLTVNNFIATSHDNLEVLEKLNEEQTVQVSRLPAKTAEGGSRWVDGLAKSVTFEGRNIVISSIQDLTDRSHFEDDLRKGRDLLKDAIDSLSEGFALYDDDNRLVMCNQRYCDMNSAVADILEPGLEWEILMRETARRGIYVEAIGREEEWIAERLDSGIEYIQDYELTQTDGKTSLVSVHPTNLGGFVVTRTDITEKKKAKIAERDSDLLVRTVLDASAAFVTMVRIGDGEILYRTPAALELLGNTKSAREHYVSPEDRADFVTQILSDGEINDYKLNLINAQDQQFPASLSARIVEYKGEEVIVTSIIDLTEQMEAEALIRRVLEACPVPVQMTDYNSGELLFRSPETIALFGAVDNAQTYYVDVKEREKYLKALAVRGWINDYRANFRSANDRKFIGAISSRLIEFQGRQVVVSNTRDLTDELAMQGELESQREMLFQNEKMSALGELLAGVAHELNNPLSVVVGHSLMLREETSDQETIRRIEKISGAAERCAKIVKTFLAMARQQPTRMEKTDVNSIIVTAVDVASFGERSAGLEIVHNLIDNLPHINADPDQITQVIINLIINAEQSITKSGIGNKISVSTAVCDNNDAIQIVVEDNGPGIPENIRARIFEPFFTTKDVGDGTGIGLSFCHRIIHSHNGKIWLNPNFSDGCQFCIEIPINDYLEEAEVDIHKSTRATSQKKILIVDDEKDVAELTAEILFKEGFHVEIATSGADAVKFLHTNSFDVVLSDLNMPEFDGRAMFEIITESFPELANRTAFITGDTMGTSSSSFLKESRRPYLEKPVSPTDLREQVYDLLDQKNGLSE